MAEENKGKQIYELFETNKLDLNSAFMINTSDRITKRISFKGLIINLKGDGTDSVNSFYSKDEIDVSLTGMRNTLNDNIKSFSTTVNEIKDAYDVVIKDTTLITTKVNAQLEEFSKELESASQEMNSIRTYLNEFIENNPDTYSTQEIDAMIDRIDGTLNQMYSATQVNNLISSVNQQVTILENKVTTIENNMTTGGTGGGNSSSGGGGTAGSAEGLSIINLDSGAVDFDNYTLAKIYYIGSNTTLSHAPNECKSGWLMVLPMKGTGEEVGENLYVKQIFYKHGSDNEVYTRTKDSAGFSEWVKLNTAKDILMGSEIPTSLSEGQIYLQYF